MSESTTMISQHKYSPSASQIITIATVLYYADLLPFGLELESFSGKSGTIESGLNVLNANVSFRMNFEHATTTNNETYYCTFYCLFDIFLVIDPETGITTLEF